MSIYFSKTPCIKEDNRNDITTTPFQDTERSEETENSDTGTNFENDGQFWKKNLDYQVC